MERKRKTLRLVGYIRVSRVAGREGDSFISPDVQRERIAAYAQGNGHSIVDWQTDLDQSGRKNDRPGFEAALQAVEHGEADGIAVAKLDRFARSVPGAAEALRRLEEVGGSLVALDLNMDTSTPTGKLMRNVLTALAEFESDRIRENWLTSRDKAIARGVHISRVPPFGYRRNDETRRLEPDPETAPLVRELFQRRAAGESWAQLCAFLDEHAPRENGRTWSTSTVCDLVTKRRVYLGDAFAGDAVNHGAHSALISRAEWEAAQGAPLAQRRNGSEGALLAGLAVCAHCGGRMVHMSDGARGYHQYRCMARRYGGTTCPSPAHVSLTRLDAFAESWLLNTAPPIAVEGLDQTDEALTRALAQLEAAEAELAAYRDANLVSLIGAESYRDGLASRAEAVKLARIELAEARKHQPLAIPRHDLLATWPELSTSERRSILAAAIERIEVRRAGRPGKGTPIEERARIIPLRVDVDERAVASAR